MKIRILLILFNLTVLSAFGQVKQVTILDTVQVKSITISKVNKKVKRAINYHLKYLKKESYCLSNKNNIMIINIKQFDSINPDKYIDLIDFTEKINEEKYVIGIFIARKVGPIMYQLNDNANQYYNFKYKGWNIYIYSNLDLKFRPKKIEHMAFPLRFEKYVLDEENGSLPYNYLNYSLDVREYEGDATIYKLDKSDIE